MTTELGYFTIAVPDVAKGQVFYGDLFGWRFTDATGHYAHVANTALPLGLSKGEAQDLSTFYFRVEDVARSCAKAVALGGTADAVRSADSGLSARCGDDQGVRFGLWQPAPGL